MLFNVLFTVDVRQSVLMQKLCTGKIFSRRLRIDQNSDSKCNCEENDWQMYIFIEGTSNLNGGTPLNTT